MTLATDRSFRTRRVGVVMLAIVALLATLTAVSHLSCIALGPACFEAQMAPPVIVQSAQSGTWLAPLGTFVVSGLFLLVAAYALSRAQLIRPLPLSRPAILVIATLCLIRGLLTVQLAVRHPELVSTDNLLVGIGWLLAGVMAGLGNHWVVRGNRT